MMTNSKLKKVPPAETNLSRPVLRSVRFREDEFARINQAIETSRKRTSIFISYNSFVVAAALKAAEDVLAQPTTDLA